MHAVVGIAHDPLATVYDAAAFLLGLLTHF